jgi:hypothetical protein
MGVRYSTRNSGELVYPPSGTIGDGYPVDRCDAYRHFAAQCVELARTMDSALDRSVLLEMALVWSRLAEYAANTAARKERAELEWPASVDGNDLGNHTWVVAGRPPGPLLTTRRFPPPECSK